MPVSPILIKFLNSDVIPAKNCGKAAKSPLYLNSISRTGVSPFDKVKKTSESFKKLEELYTGKDEAGTAIKDAIIYGSFTGNEMYSEFDTKNIKYITKI